MLLLSQLNNCLKVVSVSDVIKIGTICKDPWLSLRFMTLLFKEVIKLIYINTLFNNFIINLEIILEGINSLEEVADSCPTNTS